METGAHNVHQDVKRVQDQTDAQDVQRGITRMETGILVTIVSHVVTVRTIFVRRAASVTMDVNMVPMSAPLDVRHVLRNVLTVLPLQPVQHVITDTMVTNVNSSVVTATTTGV